MKRNLIRIFLLLLITSYIKKLKNQQLNSSMSLSLRLLSPRLLSLRLVSLSNYRSMVTEPAVAEIAEVSNRDQVALKI